MVGGNLFLYLGRRRLGGWRLMRQYYKVYISVGKMMGEVGLVGIFSYISEGGDWVVNFYLFRISIT